MSHSTHSRLRWFADVAAVLGTFFILAGLIGLMYYYTRPAPVDQAHWTERQKNLAELRAQNQEVLANYGYSDPARGTVRLPITRAIEQTITEWQNPAAGRSNLLARLARAVPQLPAGAATNAPAATNARVGARATK